MKTSTFALLLALLLCHADSSSAQRRSGNGRSMGPRQPGLFGRVIDAAQGGAIEYANVILFSSSDSTQIAGAVSNPQGRFMLTGIKPGSYYVEIRFMGYRTRTISDIEFQGGQRGVRLGQIKLEPTAINLESVDVVAEKASVSYQIDKKVINVSQQFTAVSGSAVEVLENVPSITVDIEGNVELRGSSNFTVLIDGRPSVLESNEALEQIPASTIENVEIITNPSAKFDPDGTSGIINIITKKGKLRGRSGVMNMNAGFDDKHGGDMLLNFRNGWYNAHFGLDYNKRFFPGEGREEKQTTTANGASFIFSNGDNRRGRTSYGLRGGIDFSVSAKDNIAVGLRYGNRSMARDAFLDFDEWSDSSPEHQLSTSESSMDRGGEFFAGNLDFRHRFGKKGHELVGRLIASRRDGEESTLDALLDANTITTEGRLTTEDGPSTRFRTKLDYTRPFAGNSKFEAGYQGRYRRSEDITTLSEYNPAAAAYERLSEFDNTTKYDRDIHAAYAMYAGEKGSFGYQLGLRGEVTDRTVASVSLAADTTVERWDYFPTVHGSYKLPSGQQFMASYSRRIQRPRGWYLEPFETWMDAYNVRVGNAGLLPEYIDSFELGSQTAFGSNLLSAELYYRITDNKVERVRSVYADNITLHSTENVGTDYALGGEMMLNMDLLPAWNLNYMANLYNYRVEGILDGRDFSRDSFNWSLRLNNSFRLTQSTKLQINGSYNSPTVSSQGRREGFFTANLALRQEFLQRRLSATLQLRDVLATSKFEFTSEGADFLSYARFTRDSPIVMLNLSYNINNYRPERRRERGDGGDDEDEEF